MLTMCQLTVSLSAMKIKVSSSPSQIPPYHQLKCNPSISRTTRVSDDGRFRVLVNYFNGGRANQLPGCG